MPAPPAPIAAPFVPPTSAPTPAPPATIAAVRALRPNFDLCRRVLPSAETRVPPRTNKVKTTIKTSNLFMRPPHHFACDLENFTASFGKHRSAMNLPALLEQKPSNVASYLLICVSEGSKYVVLLWYGSKLFVRTKECWFETVVNNRPQVPNSADVVYHGVNNQ
jgi:hypothetical protein